MPQLARIPIVVVKGALAKPPTPPLRLPAPLPAAEKERVLRSLGISTPLSVLMQTAFKLDASTPFVKERGILSFRHATEVDGLGWADYLGHAPGAALKITLNSAKLQRYLLEIPVGKTQPDELMHFTCKPASPGVVATGAQTLEVPQGVFHALFVVDLPHGWAAVEITCDTDYQFAGCEVTPVEGA